MTKEMFETLKVRPSSTEYKSFNSPNNSCVLYEFLPLCPGFVLLFMALEGEQLAKFTQSRVISVRFATTLRKAETKPRAWKVKVVTKYLHDIY